MPFRAGWTVWRSKLYGWVPGLLLPVGRLVWWVLIGWLLARPVAELLDQGLVAKAGVFALAGAVGMVGSLSALVVLVTPTVLGDVREALVWWAAPVVLGWIAGLVGTRGRHAVLSGPRRPQADPRRFRDKAAIALYLLAPAVPLIAAAVEARVLVVLMCWPLFASHYWAFFRETSVVNRPNVRSVRLGGCVAILSAILLAAGPPGAAYVRLWGPGVIGFAGGTVLTFLGCQLVLSGYATVARASARLVKVTWTSRFTRFERDVFAGWYGALFGPAWFTLMASGLFHFDGRVLGGTYTAFLMYLLLGTKTRDALNEACRRTTAVQFLSSVGGRKSEIQAAWLGEFRHAFDALQRQLQGNGRKLRAAKEYAKGGPSHTLSEFCYSELYASFALIGSMADEARKIAGGDFRNTPRLSFPGAGGQLPLLDAALKWVDEALALLNLLRTSNIVDLSAHGEPVRVPYYMYRAHCHQTRGWVHQLHGRREEALLDFIKAAHMFDKVGAVNLSIFAIMNAATWILGIPGLGRSGAHGSTIRQIEESVEQAVTDENLHPYTRRETALNASALRFAAGDIEGTHRLRDLAIALRIPAFPDPYSGVERVTRKRGLFEISACGVTYHSALWPDPVPEVTPPFDGRGKPLPKGYVFSLYFLRAVLTGIIDVPGARMLRSVVTMSHDAGISGDFDAVESWIESIEGRGGYAMGAELRELIGVAMRDLRPHWAAEHLIRAFQHRQTEHTYILDEELRTTLRGSREALTDLVVDHFARLAEQGGPGSIRGLSGAALSPSAVAHEVVISAKSRALCELMGDTLPVPEIPGATGLLDRERRVHRRYVTLRSTSSRSSTRQPTTYRRLHNLRQARTELETCWKLLRDQSASAAEYADLRAGAVPDFAQLRDLLRRMAPQPDSDGPSADHDGPQG